MKTSPVLPRILTLNASLLLGIAMSALHAAEPFNFPQPATPVAVEFGEKGIQSITQGDWDFIASPQEALPALFAGLSWADGPVPEPADVLPSSSEFDPETRTVTATFPWGKVSAAYDVLPGGLTTRFTVENSSDRTIKDLAVQVALFKFPEAVRSSLIGVGPLEPAGWNDSAITGQRPPVALLDYGKGVLLAGTDQTAEDWGAGFYNSHGEGKTRNRPGTFFPDIGPGETKTATLYLRFGPTGATIRQMADDLLKKYVAAYPSTLNWPDRRPIAKIMIAGNSSAFPLVMTNLNQWFNGATDVDVTTPEGLEAFRARVLEFADNSVIALKSMNAQGAITWDPEGQRRGDIYHADPRLIPLMAPEMDYKGEHELATIDAYFKKFDEAGMRHGICIRPQHYPEPEKGENGQLVWHGQTELETAEERLAEMDAKIAYAVKRWGSTMIYIDSDYHVTAAEYRALNKKYPQVLLVPEWEKPLHYAYTAPLQSFQHQGEQSTDASIRDLYPNSFIVNMIDGFPSAEPQVQENLLKAFKEGDVPMPNGWYISDDVKALSEIYGKDTKQE